MFLGAIQYAVLGVSVVEVAAGLTGQLVWGMANLPRRALKGDEGRAPWVFGPYLGMADVEESDLGLRGSWAFEAPGRTPVRVFIKIEAFRWVDARVRAGEIHSGDARYLRACVRVAPLKYIDAREEQRRA